MAQIWLGVGLVGISRALRRSTQLCNPDLSINKVKFVAEHVEMLEGSVQVGLLPQLTDHCKMRVVDMSIHAEKAAEYPFDSGLQRQRNGKYASSVKSTY